MSTRITVKGQVTVPKPIRDALDLAPGSAVDFAINEAGDAVLRKANPRKGRGAKRGDRFDKARGTLRTRWTTDGLMALLRGE